MVQRAPRALIGPTPEHTDLSNRETHIRLCLVKGDSNRGIARKFGIAEATVKAHLKEILHKIHVSNRTQATLRAYNNQFTQSGRSPNSRSILRTSCRRPRRPSSTGD